MTKAELKEKIAELQAELERLERRKPKDGEKVYCLLYGGSIEIIRYDSTSESHTTYLRRGLIFPTREEAELADRKRIAVTAIKDYVAENMPFVPDWKNFGQKKCTVFCDHLNGLWYPTSGNTTQFNFLLPYVGSIGDCNQLIRDCKEHLDVLLEEL